jgi:hypothetical protein
VLYLLIHGVSLVIINHPRYWLGFGAITLMASRYKPMRHTRYGPTFACAHCLAESVDLHGRDPHTNLPAAFPADYGEHTVARDSGQRSRGRRPDEPRPLHPGRWGVAASTLITRC